MGQRVNSHFVQLIWDLTLRFFCSTGPNAYVPSDMPGRFCFCNLLYPGSALSRNLLVEYQNCGAPTETRGKYLGLPRCRNKVDSIKSLIDRNSIKKFLLGANPLYFPGKGSSFPEKEPCFLERRSLFLEKGTYPWFLGKRNILIS